MGSAFVVLTEPLIAGTYDMNVLSYGAVPTEQSKSGITFTVTYGDVDSTASLLEGNLPPPPGPLRRYLSSD